MQALVLAGGEGTRLRPLTLTTPKPVMPLAGRPFLTFMLDWLARHGVDDAILSCGYLSDAVEARARRRSYEGMRLHYVHRGRAARHRRPRAAGLDQGLLQERLFVMNGDCLTDLDLTAELRAHEATGARVHARAGRGRGHLAATASCRPREDGEVEAFLEKQAGPAPTNRINAGAYVLERSVVEQHIPSGRAVLVRARGLPAARGQRPVRLARRGLLDRHRDARALPRGDLRPAGRAASSRRSRRATRPTR